MTDAWANSGLDLHLALDARRKTDSLESALRDMIRDGRLARGIRMPATRGLARDLGIARNSVAEVYGRLIGEGWLEARTGAGTWVAAAATASARARGDGARTVGGALRSGDASGVPVPAASARPASTSSAGSTTSAFRLDLRAGIPDTSAFPRSAWASALRRAATNAPVTDLGYGEVAGVAALRGTLASYLGRARGVVADASTVHVTHGAGHAVRLVGAALVLAGARRVAVEEYGHLAHRDILEAAGLQIVSLPVDDQGAVIERLDELDVDAVSLTPAHQFPIGVALSPARRAAVVQWAERTGGMVIEDDYDGEFRFDRRAVGALQSLSPARVVYIGTASKALGPAVGLGWCVLPHSLVDAVAQERDRDGTKAAALTQLALAEFIEHGDYDRAVRGSRARYRERRQHLESVVAERMPDARLTGMAAGLQCLLELPRGIREAEVVRHADAAGLAIAGLESFLVAPLGAGGEASARSSAGRRAGTEVPVRQAEHARQAIVVGFGAPPPHRFEEAVDATIAAIQAAGRE